MAYIVANDLNFFHIHLANDEGIAIDERIKVTMIELWHIDGLYQGLRISHAPLSPDHENSITIYRKDKVWFAGFLS